MFLLLLALCELNCAEEKVAMVITLFRHGARRELKANSYPADIFPLAGTGELTDAGMRQHYLLGRELRRKYPNVFPESFNPKRHLVYSSSYNRTILSATCNLMGIYGAGSGAQLENPEPSAFTPPVGAPLSVPDMGNDALPWRFDYPAFHTPSARCNRLFEDNCAVVNRYYDSRMKAFKGMTKTFMPTIILLGESNIHPQAFKLTQPDAEFAVSGCDFIIARSFSDPSFIVPKNLLQQCELLHSIDNYNGPSEKRLPVIYLTPMLTIIRDKLNDLPHANITAITFSGHDSNLAAFVTLFFPQAYECALNAYRQLYNPTEYDARKDASCHLPLMFGAAAVIEVVTAGPKDYRINLIYNGERLKILGKDGVSLKVFIKFLNKNIYANYRRECEGHPLNKMLLGVSITAWVAAMASLFVLTARLLLKRKSPSPELRDSRINL